MPSYRMNEYIELDWEEPFDPLYGSPIIIPVNTILWRGYDRKYAPISKRYAYYSSMAIAQEYAKQNNRDIGCFVTTAPLKIIDIRFMKNILTRIIQSNTDDKYINDFASSILSFGLCSIRHQIELAKKRYKDINISDRISNMIRIYKPNNLVEQEGIRIAETSNDSYTMAFLQELFKGTYDGFISPRTSSVFHIEKGGQLNPEMILFNPLESGLRQIMRYPHNVIIKKVSDFITNKHQLIQIQMEKGGQIISTKFYMTGGNMIYLSKHYLDDMEDLLNSGDTYAKKIYEKANKAGKRWRMKVAIINPDACSPELKISPFTDSI